MEPSIYSNITIAGTTRFYRLPLTEVCTMRSSPFCLRVNKSDKIRERMPVTLQKGSNPYDYLDGISESRVQETSHRLAQFKRHLVRCFPK